MPVLNFYMTDKDAQELFKFFNSEEDLAFIVRGENHEWKAVYATDEIGSYLLWHVPSGRISETDHTLKSVRYIENPFDGWNQERRRSISEPSMYKPYAPKISYGDYIFAFDLYTLKDGVLGLSSLEWFGVGGNVNADSKKYWQKLKRRFKKMMQEEISRSPYPKSKSKAFCFPNAFQHIENGGRRSDNPGFWKPW